MAAADIKYEKKKKINVNRKYKNEEYSLTARHGLVRYILVMWRENSKSGKFSH